MKLPPLVRFVCGIACLVNMLSLCGRSAHAQFAVENENLIEVDRNFLFQQIFQQASSEQAGRDQAATSLAASLYFVERVGDLTPAQRSKLELAGHGDIHRFFDDVQSADPGKTKFTQQEWQELHLSLQPLQVRFAAGLHGPGSLFRKTIPTVLTSAQLEIYDRMQQQQVLRHYRAAVQGTIAMIDAQLPLTQDQRSKLEELILTKTRAPEYLTNDYMQTYLVIYAISTIPEADLKPLFEPNEWVAIQSLRQQGRSIKLMLQQRGFLLEE